MRSYFLSITLFALSVSAARGNVVVDASPFEPRYSACFDWKDKFAHPAEVVAPKIVYPDAMRVEGILGEVVALVVLKKDGSPEKIAILYDTNSQEESSKGDYFATSVIGGLEKARWSPQKRRGVWFYYKTTFKLVDEGDAVATAPGVVVGIVPVPPNVRMK